MALGKNVYFLFYQNLEFVLHSFNYPHYISQIDYMFPSFCLKLHRVLKAVRKCFTLLRVSVALSHFKMTL